MVKPIDWDSVVPDFDDDVVNVALRVAFRDGYGRGLKEGLEYLQERYYNVDVVPGSDQAVAILSLVKDLGGFLRERTKDIAR